MSKKSRFRGPFEKQRDKRAQALSKSASQQFYQIHWSLPSQLSWKKFLLLTCQVLGLLVNSMAADEKYPLVNRHNLAIPIQMQLPQKQNTFFSIFGCILKSSFCFKYFEEKDDPHRSCISEITDSEKVVT